MLAVYSTEKKDDFEERLVQAQIVFKPVFIVSRVHLFTLSLHRR